MSDWYSLYSGGTGEIEEKKSRFIANIASVTTVEEANDFIAKIKKQYWDARHNCSAYVIGNDGENTRCSDDGEPSGTAGRPMLEVLTREHITNVCVVVTRYFGGTLLGTGGLVRAYQGATKEGLAHCSILKKEQGELFSVLCSYNDYGKLEFMCNSNGYYIEAIDYGSDVTMKILTLAENASSLNTEIMNITSGKAVITDRKKTLYAMLDGKAIYYD